jgi:hypothetical protein
MTLLGSVASAHVSAPTTSIIGYNAILGSQANASSGFSSQCFAANAFTYVASTGDTVTQFACYSADTVSGDPSFAIYVISAGVPTTRVGSAVTVTVPAAIGWATASASIALTAGTRYGVAIKYATAGGAWRFRYGAGTGGLSNGNNNTLPTTWTQSGTDATNVVSYYATVTGA